ncbi:MAG TPA: DNA-directed RNA polymerase subunit beta' [Candidatus Saccharimonadales bacterium]|nr:DNA-directed RNA polymerase subunit beta' [Candidatus Saccharimonadales bacterium]
MSKFSTTASIADFDAVRLAVASSDDIKSWSYGEVTKPETINYRTQKPERDGLFCERIFGPVKDISPHDAKLKGVRSREVAVDKNGEIVTKSIVRRERMGHITLAAPVAHIWFLRGTPSAIGLLLGMTVKNLERVAYFASYIIMGVDTAKRDQLLADAEAELEVKKNEIKKKFEEMAEAPEANVKALAEQQTKELAEAEEVYLEQKNQLESLEKCRLISETDFRNLPSEYRAITKVGMGGESLKALLDEIKLDNLIKELTEEAEAAKGQRHKKIMKRLKMLEGMHRAGIQPSSMCVAILPVIPPDLRPMVQLTGGRFATSDLNDLYRRVINRNNRLKKLMELNAPEVIRRNEMRMLQEAVDALIDNNAARGGRAVSTAGGRRRLKSLSDMLKGKQGRFRQNLLGKRVDYSGRSVIVAGPELKISQCGLPKLMALELFKPFVINYLLQHDHAHNIKSATRLIESGNTVIWDALDEVIKGKYVLLNRAPTLHRLSIQAFMPKLIEGKAIQLHPLVCKGFNADFDGDQMAVHLPLSDAAQKEAAELMSATKNLLKPADGSPVLNISQDIVLGCYYLTYPKPSAQTELKLYSSIHEAIFAYDKGLIKLQSPIRIPVKGEARETTLGRFFFNEALPADMAYQEDVMTKKKLNRVLSMVFQQYGQDRTAEIADELKDLSLKYATEAAVSTGMTDYFEVDWLEDMISDGDTRAKEIHDQYEMGLITDEERYSLTVGAWRSVDKQVSDRLQEELKNQDTSIAVMVDSGARGDLSNVKLAAAMIGVMVDATGREIELPIRSSYKKGLSPLESFVATRGTRKGLIDTALKTADSGYLTRRLVDVSQDIFTVTDESDDPGFAILRSEAEETMVSFADRLYGRCAAEDIKVAGKVVVSRGDIITRDVADAIEASDLQEAKILSILTDTSLRGISLKSYGIDMATGVMVKAYEPVGVIAAQSVGEPGTQLTLNTFHASGVAGEDITQGLPRVEELFEARTPKGQAYLSEVTGDAEVWENGDVYVVQITPSESKTETLELDGRIARIKSGSDVRAGDVLASDDDESRPLVAPFDGKVHVTKKQIVLTAGATAPVRYEIPGFKQLTVQSNDHVHAGDRLTTGSINLHDLLRLKGIEATERYIINEVLRIYAAQGQDISAKHLEVIVRQMFSRVQIEDPGDSLFVTGDIVSKAAVIEASNLLTKDSKQPVEFTQLLLGITKVSTWSDSFLSAASFQDTTRVLINAATSGKVDKLYGLKENVIIGRKIPVGTGARDIKE